MAQNDWAKYLAYGTCSTKSASISVDAKVSSALKSLLLDICDESIKTATLEAKLKSVFLKRLYLDMCKSVIEKDPHFSIKDEEMLAKMDVETNVNSIRLMALKKRLCRGDESWIRSFCDAGGISILVENTDNTLEIMSRTHVEASILYELLSCIELAIKRGGLTRLICTRGAIDAIMMAMDFKYKALAMKAIQILDFIVTMKTEEASFWNIRLAVEHMAYLRGKMPFEFFVDAIVPYFFHLLVINSYDWI